MCNDLQIPLEQVLSQEKLPIFRLKVMELKSCIEILDFQYIFNEIHIGFGFVSSSVVTTYPLEEALQRLRQKTNRVNFSEAEILGEAKRMVEEASNE